MCIPENTITDIIDSTSSRFEIIENTTELFSDHREVFNEL